MSETVCVGAIAGGFGTSGEVRLKSFTAVPDDIAAYGTLTTEDGTRSFEITLTGRTSGALTARLSGVRTREQAEDLRGTRLYAHRDRLPALPEDEFYYTDLIGLSVHDSGGALLGRIRAVLNHGAADLLEIEVPGASRTVLLPFTRTAVPTVDLAAARIVADPPEGIF